MAYRVRPCRSLDELGAALGAIGHYFGWVPSEDEVERFSKLLPVDRMHAAFDGKEIVGGAGVFPFEMTVPGAVVPCAGVTVVGVLPTHRRRGILRRMMRAQIDDVRERGTSRSRRSGPPSRRSTAASATASRRWRTRSRSAPPARRCGRGRRRASARCASSTRDEALKSFPRIYDRVRRVTPGFLSRTKRVVGAPPPPRRPFAPAAGLGPAQPRALRARRASRPGTPSTASRSPRRTDTGSGACAWSRRSAWTRSRRSRSGAS